MSKSVTLSDICSIGKAIFALYCLVACTTCIAALCVLTITPFMVLHKRTERRVQEFCERLWSFVLLGTMAFCTDSKLILTLPVECGVEMESIVRQKLSNGFLFDNNKDERKKAFIGDSLGISKNIVIANHQLYMDWIYIWSIMSKLKGEGTVKIILKRSLANVPLFGLGMRLLNFIFLHRDWNIDRAKFDRRLRRLLSGDFPFTLVMFPEGTTMAESTKIKSDAFAVKNGVEVTKWTLLPRVTGFQFALKTIGCHIEGVFDLTIGYTGCQTSFPENEFTLKSMFFAGQAPKNIHVHVRYYRVKDIPYDNAAEFEKWLYTIYQEKDKLLDGFKKEEHFKGPRTSEIPLAPKGSMIYISVASLICTISIVWTVKFLLAKFLGIFN